jgi:hypothetical protein
MDIKAIAQSFLGTFAKLQKVTVNFILSTHQSVSMEELGCQWTDI